MPLEIVRNDITKMTVDAIVNAANTDLRNGGGVCGAIFSAAGINELEGACAIIGGCAVGQAVITEGYNLKVKYIIHTVGPIYKDGQHHETELLYNAYRNSLELAKTRGIESIAFPLISSGIYRFPKEEAIEIAMKAIGDFLEKVEMLVYLVVYDRDSFVLSEQTGKSIQAYIDEHYIDEHPSNYIEEYPSNYQEDRPANKARLLNKVQLKSEVNDAYPIESVLFPSPQRAKKKRQLEDLIEQIDDTFSMMLFRLIDAKGMSDVETYKRANIDRKLFSKIKNDNKYNPSRKTAIAFAISLKLNLDETKDLLSRAGYTLSKSNLFDIIIEYFIIEGNYNIYEINEALFTYEQDLLGA